MLLQGNERNPAFCYANLYIDGLLNVCGNFTVDNCYRIYETSDSGYLKISGDVNMNNPAWSDGGEISAGVIEIKGNYNGVPGDYRGSVTLIGTNTVVLSGNEEQKISYLNASNLVINNQSEAGVFINTPSNVTGKISNVSSKLHNGKDLYLNGGYFFDGIYNGDISIKGNVSINHDVNIIGNLYAFDHGSSTISLSNEATVKVMGNAELVTSGSDSIFHIQEGATFIVEGDLLLQGNERNPAFCSAILKIDGDIYIRGNFLAKICYTILQENENSYFTVDNNMNIESHYWNGNPYSKMTAGILEINGNFNGFLESTAQHTILLNGERTQTFSNKCKTSNIIIKNHNGISFLSPINITIKFDHNRNSFTLYDSGKGSSFPDYDGDGYKDNVDPYPLVKHPDEHDYVFTKTIVPTCLEQGYDAYICPYCNGVDKRNLVDIIPHNYVFSETVLPTCTAQGYDLYICSLCNGNEKRNYTNKIPHEYVFTKTVLPTCTSQGYDLYTCSVCNGTEKRNYTNKIPHEYAFTKTVLPTCTAQGYDLYTCSNCNGTEKRNTVSAIGHKYSFTKTVAPTCTAQGYDLYTCSNCNGTERRNIVSSTGHSYEVTSNTATCTEAGIKISVCSKCGDKKEENVSALGHTYSKVYTAPTCTQTGGYTNTCTRCGDITYDIYAAKGHDYGEIAGQDYVNKIAGSTISANPNYFNEFYHTSSSIGSTATAAILSTNMAVPNEIRLDINNMGTIKDYQFAIGGGIFSRRECECIFAYNESTGRSPEESAIPYTDSDGNLVDMHYIDYKTNNEWVSGRYLIENNKIVDLSGTIVCDNFTETRPHIVYTKSEALEKGIMNSDGTVNVSTELANQVSFSAGIPGVYFTATNIAPSLFSSKFVDVFGFDKTMQDQIKGGKYDVNLCFYEQNQSGFSKTTYKIYDGSLIKKIPATLTAEERIEYTCMDCGETRVETCALKLADFKIAAASISLANNIRMNYKVLKTAVADFENPYIEVTRNGKTVKITEYSEQGDYYVFSYKNIAPQCMGDTLTAVLYGTHNGILYSSNALDFSVKEYAYRMLQICEPEQYSSLRTLLVDMLNYGSEAQIYMNYSTDKLVNADLTEQQKSWASNDDLSLTNIANPNYKEIENASVIWKGAGLSLYDSVSVRYTFTAENIHDLSFRVTCNDRIWNYDRDDIIDNGDGTYSILFTDLNADQMSDAIYITAYNSDIEVSNTLCYSVESYAALVHSSMPNSGLEDLTRAMIKYGTAAKKYAM